MLKESIAILLVCGATGVAAATQEPSVPPKAPEAPAQRSTPAQAANIRVELTITDQRSDGQTPPKAVTLLIEDRQSGRIRTGRGNAALNLDARAEIVREGRIRVMVTLEYTPQEPDRQTQPPIQESVTALLEDGKPLVVSQSADPISDRKVRVEVKATIVR